MKHNLKRIRKRRKDRVKQHYWVKRNYGMGTYYHGTDKLMAKFIEKEGLKTTKDKSKEMGFPLKGTSIYTDPEYVYVFPEKKRAKVYAQIVSNRSGIPPAIIELDIPDKELKEDFAPGMEWMAGKKHKGSIPPEQVKRIFR